MTKKELLDLFELHNVQDDDDIHIALCEDTDIAPIKDIKSCHCHARNCEVGFTLIAGEIDDEFDLDASYVC